jgi:hypothetical protein
MLTHPETPLILSVDTAAVVNRRITAAAADCDAILAAHSPPVAKLSCLRGILAEQLDMDMTGPGWPARLLGFLARHRPGPFTWTMIRLTGETPRIDTIPGSERERRATGAEADALAVLDEAGLWVWERRGLLTLGTTIAAEVSLRVLPARLADEEMARIRKGEPCGQVIPGLVRAHRGGVTAWPADPAVVSAAVLQRPTGRPFGFAGELVTAGVCGRLAGLS